jgi:ferredoxin-thioredoxin reductase catalytic chain
MSHEARKAALRDFYAPLVTAMGYKFTPDDDLADFLLEQEAVLEENKGAPYCPCQVRTRERAHDMKIVCPCIPFHRAHFDAMRRCWCGLFVHLDVTDPDSLPQIAASELGIEE